MLVFVYDKNDDPDTQTGRLDLRHTIFVEKERTADYQITTALRKLIENGANRDDILACFEDRYMPFREPGAIRLAEKVLRRPPELGMLGKKKNWSWFDHAIESVGRISGVLHLHGGN